MLITHTFRHRTIVKTTFELRRPKIYISGEELKTESQDLRSQIELGVRDRHMPMRKTFYTVNYTMKL